MVERNNFLYIKELEDVNINSDRVTHYRAISFQSLNDSVSTLLKIEEVIDRVCETRPYLPKEKPYFAVDNPKSVSISRHRCTTRAKAPPSLTTTTETKLVKELFESHKGKYTLPATAVTSYKVWQGSLIDVTDGSIISLSDIKVTTPPLEKLYEGYDLCIQYTGSHEPMSLVSCTTANVFICIGTDNIIPAMPNFRLSSMVDTMCLRARQRIQQDHRNLVQTMRPIYPNTIWLRIKKIMARRKREISIPGSRSLPSISSSSTGSFSSSR